MVFGGLISYTGRLEQVSTHRLRAFLPRAMFENTHLGDSIAVNGVCLTVAEMEEMQKENDEEAVVYFDLSDETLAKTTLGHPPSLVHMEPALRLSDAVGGHVMSGHVHGVAKMLQKVNPKTGEMFIDLTDFLGKGFAVTGQLPVLKDSISIDGVSLTVAEVLPEKHAVRVALIDHTMKWTLFTKYDANQPVNIEYHNQTSIATVAATNELLDAHDDAYWMKYAVAEAEKARFTAPPNPWVGAVLVDQWNRKVAAGHHIRPGERHAERMIESSMDGCTLYVTLEPCSHTGRTPPCVEYLIERKPSRVVVGILDPDVRVRGRGVTALRNAGIQVDVGVAADEVAKSLRPYLWHRTHEQTPYVVGKLAVSMDNCFAYAADTATNRTWITGEHARKHSHGERAGSQCIVVGKNTKEMDQPKLNVRYNYQVDRQPKAVVSTRELKWLQSGDASTLQVLVEGGPELHDDLLQKGKVQEFLLYRSTRLLGLAGVRWMPSFLDDGWELVETQTFPDGDTLQRFLHHSSTACIKQAVAQSHQDPSEFLPSAVVAESAPPETLTAGGAKATTTAATTNPAAPGSELRFDTIETAVKALKEGGLVVVMDNEDRENEGDLMMLADRISLRNMKLMLTHTTGIVCATLTSTRAKLLDLPLMVPNKDNTDNHQTKFTVSVDAKEGVTTGVSALDRMRTLSVLGDPTATPIDLRRPGHIFPLIAAPGGLTQRQGHTEAGVELARLAGMEQPCMVISELYDQSTGKMMNAMQCAQLGLPIITVDALKEYCAPKFTSVPLQGFPTDSNWEVAVFSGTKVVRRVPPPTVSAKQTPPPPSKLLLRIHSECFTGDVLGSALCDCGNQLHHSLRHIDDCTSAPEGQLQQGMIIFPAEHEGRGIGLDNKMKAYHLQRKQGLSTFEANKALGYPDDARDFSVVPQVLSQMGITPETTPTIQLLTENPAKVAALKAAGFAVEPIALAVEPIDTNRRYLTDKRAAFEQQGGAVAVDTKAIATATANAGATSTATHATFQPAGYGLTKMAPKPLELTEVQRSQMKDFTAVIVQAEWHRHLSDPLVDTMLKELKTQYGIEQSERHFAPGSFEIPRVIQHLAAASKKKNNETHGTTTGNNNEKKIFFAVGILVRGDTDHYDLVAKESTSGIARLQLDSQLWIVNAILAVHNIQQAADRCLPDGPAFVGLNMAQAAARLALTAVAEDE